MEFDLIDQNDPLTRQGIRQILIGQRHSTRQVSQQSKGAFLPIRELINTILCAIFRNGQPQRIPFHL